MIVNVFVAFHESESSFLRCCSWLKGAPPGTRTLAAGIQKKSRLQMTGPMGERAELSFFPATEATRLANIHPTWAGTFVLAALGASFPGKNFLFSWQRLLATLFEAFDLWQERVSRWVLMSHAKPHIPSLPTSDLRMINMWKTAEKAYHTLKLVMKFCWSRSLTLN